MKNIFVASLYNIHESLITQTALLYNEIVPCDPTVPCVLRMMLHDKILCVVEPEFNSIHLVSDAVLLTNEEKERQHDELYKHLIEDTYIHLLKVRFTEGENCFP